MHNTHDTPRKIDVDVENSNDLLRDSDGNFYEISEEYYKKQVEARQPSVDKEMELRLAKELLHSHLNRLTRKQRDVIYYTMMWYTQKTIARKMSITISAVQKHLYLAKKKLAKIITGNKQILKEGLGYGAESIDSTND